MSDGMGSLSQVSDVIEAGSVSLVHELHRLARADSVAEYQTAEHDGTNNATKAKNKSFARIHGLLAPLV
jgi:hypothetical protein